MDLWRSHTFNLHILPMSCWPLNVTGRCGENMYGSSFNRLKHHEITENCTNWSQVKFSILWKRTFWLTPFNTQGAIYQVWSAQDKNTNILKPEQIWMQPECTLSEPGAILGFWSWGAQPITWAETDAPQRKSFHIKCEIIRSNLTQLTTENDWKSLNNW